MNIVSLVKMEEVRKDPRKLAYLYPNMPVRKYAQKVEEYHRKISLMQIERTAAMFGAVVVPAACIHHRRRRSDRRVSLYGRNYYIFRENELTTLEYGKYLSYCVEG